MDNPIESYKLFRPTTAVSTVLIFDEICSFRIEEPALFRRYYHLLLQHLRFDKFTCLRQEYYFAGNFLFGILSPFAEWVAVQQLECGC